MYTRNSIFFKDLSLHCDLDLQDSNPIFLHDTPGHGDAPSYQVWLHTVLVVHKICDPPSQSDWYSVRFELQARQMKMKWKNDFEFSSESGGLDFSIGISFFISKYGL